MCAKGLQARCSDSRARRPRPGQARLKLAVTPTFARSILMPRLRQFIEAYPEIDLTLQVSIPLLDVVAEDADLMVRFGTGTMPMWSMSELMTRRGHAAGLARLRARARPV
jgi:DNA-binding transcriptional LysR family regulator